MLKVVQNWLPTLSGIKLWGLRRFNSDCTASNWRSLSGTTLDQKDFISESCTQMLLQLHDIYDPNKVSHLSNSEILVPSQT